MRFRMMLIALLALATLAVAADDGAPDLAADKAAILKLHMLDREGHLRSDAELIAAPLAPKLDEIVDGHIRTMTRDEAKQQFEQYLKAVKFTKWEDAADPVLKISSDGQMAWMIVETKAEVASLDHPDEKHDFSNSSIQTFEKGQDGSWHMTAIAATAGK